MDRSEFLAAQTEMYPDIKEPVTDKLFLQNGRKVFREVCTKVSEIITDHLHENELQASEVTRRWLHQANANRLD